MPTPQIDAAPQTCQMCGERLPLAQDPGEADAFCSSLCYEAWLAEASDYAGNRNDLTFN